MHCVLGVDAFTVVMAAPVIHLNDLQFMVFLTDETTCYMDLIVPAPCVGESSGNVAHLGVWCNAVSRRASSASVEWASIQTGITYLRLCFVDCNTVIAFVHVNCV